MNEYIIKILEKMFEMVYEKYTPEFIKQPNWYWLKTWDKDTENEFSEWMFAYLKRSKDARTAVMKRPSKDPKLIKKVVSEFIWQYGWKVKENEPC